MALKFLRRAFLAILLAVIIWNGAPAARADSPPLGPIPAEASGANIDPAAAARAYLDTIPPEAKVRSDAYFEGGYWLVLWDALVAIGISLLVLATGWSAAWRDWAARLVKWRWLQVSLYGVIYIVVVTILGFPMVAYESFYREHQYNMATQDFGAWFAEQGTALAVQVVLFVLLLPALYAVFRRAPRTWWLWGTVVVTVFQAIGLVLAPIYIMPRFNTYKPLENPAIREQILTLARANQIPVTDVYEVDASRQTKRVSANVSGAFGAARINLNDNLISRCSLPEIRQVMAHEMGHYVLNHIYKLLLELSVTTLVLAFIARLGFDAAVRRWGTRWRIEGIGDPAALPLLMMIFSILFLLMTPVFNSIVRETEIEADAFGINTSREPDGFAQSAIKLGEYRKMDPGPIEEFMFFDHPSGRARIRMAMEWKAAHPPAGTPP